MGTTTPGTDETLAAPAILERRAVLMGAAWTVPVVAVAMATPLAAASDAPVARTAYLGGDSTSTVGSQATDPATALTVQGPTTFYVQSGDDGYGDVEVTLTVARTDGGTGAAPQLLIGSISSPQTGPLNVIFRNLGSGSTLETPFELPPTIAPRTLFPVEFTYSYEATAAAEFDALPVWSITATAPYLPDSTGTIAAITQLVPDIAIG